MSAWHVGGSRGSGIVSSAADVLGMSMMRMMRGVGGVFAWTKDNNLTLNPDQQLAFC